LYLLLLLLLLLLRGQVRQRGGSLMQWGRRMHCEGLQQGSASRSKSNTMPLPQTRRSNRDPMNQNPNEAGTSGCADVLGRHLRG